MPRKNAKSQKNPPKKKAAVKKTVKTKLLKFEDCIQQINVEIIKRKNKWNLTA